MTRWLLVPLALAACHPVSTKDTADDTDRDTDVDSDTPPTDDTDPIQPDDTDPIETDETVPGETDETDESDVRETGGSLPDARALEPGDLVITELMIQPACINDDAEYIEVLYRGAAPIDLIGLSLADAGATWTLATHRATRPGETILLWREPLPGRSQCYGFTQGLAYASPISLSNTGDAVWLDDPDGERIDAVDYRGWTVPFAAALQLDPGHNDAAENDVEASWCASTTPLDPAPDLGTPGAPNPPCPEPPVETGSPGDSDTPDDTDVPVDTDVPASGPLVLSEVVDYGPDPDLRYIEVCNPSDRPVNLLGWSIERYSNGGTTPARIALTGATLLPGDAWVVASTAGDPATWLATFGVEPDQRSGSVSSNGDDAWTLSWDDGAGPAQVDVFGEVGVDGTGAAWEYEDAAAARAQGGPSLVWQAADWVIRGDALAPTPGRCGPPDPLPVDTDETDVPDTAPPPRGIHPGELVINGLLPDPASPCADGDGEWLTFVNVTDETLDLDGLVIADASRSFLYGGALQIAPGAEAVAWPAPGTSECFGLVDGLVYSASVTLNNGGDTVSLAWGGTTVDEVTYPSARSGKARELDPRYTDAAANDDDAWWCDAVTTFSPSVDLGTPGTPNALCDLDTDLPVDSDTPDTDLPDTDLPDTDLPDTDLPDTDRVDTDLPEPVDTVPPRGVHAGELVINGLLANPASPCADEDGEWLTFVNVTDEWLDLDGVTLSDPASATTWSALAVPPGAEVIAWRSPRATQCHGFVDGVTWAAGLSLNNSGDTVRLTWAGELIDEVSYPSQGAHDGAAWELDPRRTDAALNDDPAVWCDATAPLGATADRGTPGAPNDRCDLGNDTGEASDSGDSADASDPIVLDTDAADTDPADTDLPPPPPVLLLTEIADTVDASARFVEITNLTGADVDTSGWALVRYSNGSPTGTSHDLDVIAVADGASFVVAYSAPDFEAAFGYAPEMTWGGVNQNGNDAFALTYEGVIVDVFGELGVDGLGTAWEYVDASATRRAIAQAPRPSATFELRDWYIRTTTKVTPGRWGAPYDDSTPLPDTGGDSGDSDAPGDSDLIVDSGATGDSAGDTDVRESIPVAVDDTDVVPPRDTAPGVEGQLMLSEIADPIAASDAKYVELYNPSDAPVDLARWELARYSNGSTTGAFRRLPHAWLRPGAAYVVAYDAAEFEAFFGFAPDSTWGGVTGNGNDVYALYEVAAGRSTPYDLYGQLGVDGTGLGWDYANAVATRRETATGPRSRFDLHEWLVTIEGYTPGSWSPAPGGTELDTWFYDTSALDQAPDTAIDTDTTPPAVDTGAPRVILSEIADPGLFDARYVELYNAGPRTRHLGSWAVEIYANGGVQPTTHVLPSIDLGPGEVWVIGFTGAGFRSAWGFAPDDRWTGLTGNGDDVYALARWTGAAWTVVDVYGEIGTDGAGTPWAYPSQDAARDPGVTRGVDVFDLAEWTLSADPAAFTPGTRP